jgi:hypothetical protein
MPEDVVHRLLGQPAQAHPIVMLPMPGLAAYDHVSDHDRLKGLPHALHRQLKGQAPGKTHVDLARRLQTGAVPADPLQVMHLQGLRQHLHG